jgi:hypothetical protein
MVDEMSWYQFSTLPGMNKVPQHEVERQYRIYLNEIVEQRIAIHLMQEQIAMTQAEAMAVAASNGGGGGIIQQQQSDLPSNAIELVVSTGDGTTFGFGDIIVSALTTIDVDWGDETTDTYEIASDDGFSHSFTDREEPYIVRLTFSDISLVTRIFVSNNSANVTEARGLQNLINLTHLEIDNNALTSLDVSGMTSLIDIDVSDCVIPNTEGEKSLTSVNVAGCTSLERLELDDSDFSAGLPNLNGLTSLTYLDLDGCGLTGEIDLSNVSSALINVDLSSNSGITSVILPEGYLDNVNINGAALTETAVNNILQWLDGSGVEGGYVNLQDGTSAVPTGIGATAKTSLVSKDWTVYVNQAPPARVGIAASTDFDIVGDFTIEMFVNMANTDGFPRPYSFGTYPAANAISLEAGTLYFWANNQNVMGGNFAPTIGNWNHIAVMGSGSNVYMFVDGNQIASAAYGGSISSQNLPLTIGYGNENNSGFNGKMSNFRWTDAALYPTEGFTKPNASLTDLADTVLLIFQGNNLNAQLTDNSGNNHNATNEGATYSELNPFPATPGSLQMGNI